MKMLLVLLALSAHLMVGFLEGTPTKKRERARCETTKANSTLPYNMLPGFQNAGTNMSAPIFATSAQSPDTPNAQHSQSHASLAGTPNGSNHTEASEAALNNGLHLSPTSAVMNDSYLMGHILSIAFRPFLEMSVTNKATAMAFEYLDTAKIMMGTSIADMAKRLAQVTGNEAFRDLKPCLASYQLFRLSHTTVGNSDMLLNVFNIDSFVHPDTPPLLEQVIKAWTQAEDTADWERYEYFTALAHRFVERENFESLAKLLTDVPPLYLYLEDGPRFPAMQVAYKLTLLESWDALRVLMDKFPFGKSILAGILSTTLPAEFIISLVFSREQCRIRYERICHVLMAIGKSYSEKCGEDAHFRRDRNEQLIAHFRALAPTDPSISFWADYAKFLGSIVIASTSYNSLDMSRNWIEYFEMFAQGTLAMGFPFHPRSELLSEVLTTAIHAKNRRLFEIFGQLQPEKLSDVAISVIDSHSDFKNLLSVESYKVLTNRRSNSDLQVMRLRALKSPSSSGYIKRVKREGWKLAMFAEFCNFGTFEAAVKNVRDGDEMSMAIDIIATIIDNPARYIYTILRQQVTGYDASLFVRRALGKEKVLRALLLDSSGADDIVEKVERIEIDAYDNIWHQFLNDPALATAVSSERGRRITSRFLLKDFAMFRNLGWRKIVRLLRILKVRVEIDFFVLKETFDSDLESFSSLKTVADLICFAGARNILPYLASFMVKEDLSDESPFTIYLHNDRENPALLTIFSLFDLWRVTDSVGFWTWAPAPVIRAFCSEPPRHWFEYLLVDTPKKIRLMINLAQFYSGNFEKSVEFKSDAHLKKFLQVSLPVFNEHWPQLTIEAFVTQNPTNAP